MRDREGGHRPTSTRLISSAESAGSLGAMGERGRGQKETTASTPGPETPEARRERRLGLSRIEGFPTRGNEPG